MKQLRIGFAIFIALLVARSGAQAQGDELSWESCKTKVGDEDVTAECTTLSVPENRQDPGSRQITIPVMRIPATGAAPAEPIFFLEGGPGKSNLGFNPPADLLGNHDIVQVGYRGTDSSVVLDCPEFKKALKGKGNDLFSEESQANMATAMAACAERLGQEGVDLDGYNILEVTEDINVARQALGYERINLLSVSYGTRVAQIYAQRYPENVARSAMIGVNPPGRFILEPEIIDYQLGLYADRCTQDAACSQRTSNLAETIRQVNANMPKRWLLFPIDPGKVKVVALAQLFHADTAPMAFDAYLAAADGDASGLAFMSLAYNLQVPKLGIWGDMIAKGYSADFDPERDYDELAAPDSIMGSPIPQLLWPIADNWTQTLMPEEYRQVQPSAVETLIINGNLDFSTPAENAINELLPVLENGQKIILSDLGHDEDFWNAQPEAAVQLLLTYFDTGEVDESLFEHQPVNFEVEFPSFPTLGKF
ncbi:MAG: alpha/beta hydrolase, partial [Chloroflexi bacterium]|nr:alpha/beta hydrolase [Chloroflexota bacterium]